MSRKGCAILGPNARLDLLGLIQESLTQSGSIQRPSHAWAHGDVPVHLLSEFGTLVGSLVARIGKDVGFLTVPQRMVLFHDADRLSPSVLVQAWLAGIYAELPQAAHSLEISGVFFWAINVATRIVGHSNAVGMSAAGTPCFPP
jgi:hypothetical protein